MRRRGLLVAGGAALLWPRAALAAGASLQAPGSAKAGWSVRVGWSGPGAEGDWIGIAPRGESPSYFFNNCWANATQNPLRLKVPLATGRYEVRYVQGDGAAARVLAAKSLRVGSGAVRVSAPGSVGPGQQFRVDYDGPNDFSDYVAITEPGAGDLDTEYGYVRTNGYDHVTIRAPETPGTYEVRYVVNADEIGVLGSARISVG